MSDSLEQRMREDRHMRNAAFAIFQADLNNVQSDFKAQSIASRVANRISEGATDVFEEAVVVADDNKGVLAALVAAIVLWFARNPIISILSDEEHTDERGDEEFSETESD